MCLTVLDKNHHIAESDITCYKLFKIKSGKLVTKYQEFEVDPTKELVARGRLDIVKCNEEWEINGGVIHSFSTILGALLYSERSTVLYECVIPKGTKYYIGKFSASGSYGSEKLTLIRKIEVTEYRNLLNEYLSDIPNKFENVYDIKSYSAALKYLNEEATPETGDECVDAFIKLRTIARAWNKFMGFEINFKDFNQYRYAPYFYLSDILDSNGAGSGFGCCGSYYGVSTAGADVGGRLLFENDGTARLFGFMFFDLYKKYLMLDGDF